MTYATIARPAGFVPGPGHPHLPFAILPSRSGRTDPLTIIAITMMFLGIAIASALVPAWRAARIDATIAIREC